MNRFVDELARAAGMAACNSSAVGNFGTPDVAWMTNREEGVQRVRDALLVVARHGKGQAILTFGFEFREQARYLGHRLIEDGLLVAIQPSKNATLMVARWADHGKPLPYAATLPADLTVGSRWEIEVLG
jgi:hypothetical protein